MKKTLKIMFAIGSSLLVLFSSLISPLFAAGTWQAQFVHLHSVYRDYPLYSFSGNDRSQPYVSWSDPISYTGYFKVGNEVLFCLEPDVAFASSISYTRQAYNEEVDAVLSQDLFGLGYTPAQIALLSKISSVGYGFNGDFSEAMASATQIKIWEVKHPGQLNGYPADVAEKIAQIDARLKAFDTPVSFQNETLRFDGYGEEHALMLQDTNQVFSHYFELDKPGNVQTQKEGDTLRVWIEKGAPKAGVLRYQALYDDGQASNTKKCYYDNLNQTIGNFGKVNTPKMQIDYQVDIAPEIKQVEADSKKEGRLDLVLRLKKSDTETGKPIKNTEFEFYKDDVLIFTGKTDEKGEIRYDHQEQASFTSSTYSASYVENFERFDEESQNQFLSQGYFAKEDDAKAFAKQQADQDVNEQVKRFEQADHIYKAVETKSGKGYYLDPQQSVSIKEQTGSGQVEFELINQSIKGQIEIEKVGELLVDHTLEENDTITSQFTYEEKGLANVEFSIYAREAIVDPADEEVLFEKDALVETIVTNEEGKASSSALPLGSYFVKETKTLEGFVLDETEYDFDLTSEQSDVLMIQQSQKIENDRMKAQVEVNKKDSKTKKPLRDVLFAIRNMEEIAYTDQEGNEQIIEAGTLLETKRSDEEGKLAFDSDLPYGAYEIKEMEPAPGYIASEIVQTIQKEAWTQTLNPFVFDFENDFSPIRFEIRKVDQYDNPITKKEFEFGVYRNDEKIESRSGDQETGIVSFTFEEAGLYWIQEEKAPDGYVLSKEKVKVEIKEDGSVLINDEVQEKQEVYSYRFKNERILVVQPQVPTALKTGGFKFGVMMLLSGLAIVLFKHKQRS